MTQTARSAGRRPIGVTIVAVLAIAWSAVTIVEALTLFPSSVAANPVDQGLDTGPLGQALALAGVVVGVVYFLVAFGLWDRHRWAYWLTLGIAAGHIVGSVVGVLVGGPTWAMAIVASVVPAFIIVCLVTPGARRAFRV